jgi:hypothetical protein
MVCEGRLKQRRRHLIEKAVPDNSGAAFSLVAHLPLLTICCRDRFQLFGSIFMPEEKRYLSNFDSTGRKKVPMFSGLLAYFPDACAAVAEHSYKGNEKHNPGEPLHHSRGKSMDHTDCIIRHVSNYEGMDGDSLEVVALAWRSMALAQEVLERKFGLTLPEGVTDPRAFKETNSLVGPNGEQAPQAVYGSRER